MADHEPINGRLILRSLLDTYGYTAGLKDGSIRSSRLDFDFDEVRPIFDGFTRTVQLLDFHLSELATATYVQAVAYGTELTLLPIGVLNRFHHGSIIHNVDRGVRSPRGLNGRRIGVRAYSQTTAVWTRGLLMTEYGLDPDTVEWVAFEDAHVLEYEDPPNVTRAPTGETIESLLLSGGLDAAIVGRDKPRDPRIADLIPDAPEAERAWYKRTGILPINHVVVIRRDLIDAHPWLVDELGRLFATGRDQYLGEIMNGSVFTTDDRFRADLVTRGIDPIPFGVAAVRPALQMMIDYCVAQRLVPRAVTIGECLDPRVGKVGAP
jgi:4,5-dihydroxyphthalate decarboxylase